MKGREERLCQFLFPFEQRIKGGLPQLFDHVCLCFAENLVEGTIISKGANRGVMDAFIDVDWAVDGFDHIKQADIFGVKRQTHTSTGAAGCVNQPRYGQLGDDFR